MASFTYNDFRVVLKRTGLKHFDAGQEARCWIARLAPCVASMHVLAAQVCWVRGEEYGVETITIDKDSFDALQRYLGQELHRWMESHW
jgi:hypothetical protein